jgi:ABC-2 type transport system permease protein
MMGAPGSVVWLLRHELRLAWFNAASSSNSRGGRRPGTATLLILAALWLLLHGVAWYVLRRLDGIDRTALPLLAAVSTVLAVGVTAMVASSLKASVVALFERGDLDLLLSSPLPSRSIFTVRLAAIAAGTAAVFYFLLAPFAHAGLALGQPAWLGLYPAVIGLAVLSACFSMLLTLGLVRSLGARRTRVLAQVLGAVAGALIFLLSQAYAHVSPATQGAVAGWLARLARDGVLGPDSLLWLPARAALGDWPAALALLALSTLAFLATAAFTHRFFVRGLQQAASLEQAPRRPAGALRLRVRVRRSLFETVVIKEWRLILRDPQLISQVLLQLIYLVPMCFLIFSDSGIRLEATAAGLSLLCGSLAGSLTWIAIAAEDTPDLLHCAPVPVRAVRLAKLCAAVMPPLLLVALPLLWLVARAPVAGLIACFSVTAAVWGAALVVLWCGRPGRRSDFKGRGKTNFVSNILEMCSNLAWSAVGGLLVAIGNGKASEGMLQAAAAALAAGPLVLLLAWALRIKRG